SSISGLNELIKTEEQYRKEISNTVTNSVYEKRVEWYKLMGDEAKNLAKTDLERSKGFVYALENEIRELE
ncbi:MAG: hypothetical protein KDD03_11600, partial [Gelidibacter sp.]|nr:hypothetical protein [Gelidibacter sp.]